MLTAPTEPTKVRRRAAPEFVSSLDKGLRVLQAFCSSRPRLTLSEVAALTRLTPATARRSLHTLVSLGYLRHFNRQFSLRPRVLALGTRYLRVIKAEIVLQPFLNEVALRTGCDSSVDMLDDADVICIGHSSSSPLIPVVTGIGTRHPAHQTASGRVLLAFLPGTALSERLRRIGTNPPGGSIELVETLREVRSSSFAVVDDESGSGDWSIAFPIQGPDDEVVAAISCSHVTHRSNKAETTRKCLLALRRAARGIEGTMRQQPDADLLYRA